MTRTFNHNLQVYETPLCPFAKQTRCLQVLVRLPFPFSAPPPVHTLIRSKFTSLRSRSATASTALTQISAMCLFRRPTLQASTDASKQRIQDETNSVVLT